MGRTNDHRLAATHRQPSERSLVAHALGQANGIDHGTFIVGVGQITTAPQRRPETTVVDGDHRLQPGDRVDTEVQRLKTSALHESEHRTAPWILPVASIGFMGKYAEASRNKPLVFTGFAT